MDVLRPFTWIQFWKGFRHESNELNASRERRKHGGRHRHGMLNVSERRWQVSIARSSSARNFNMMEISPPITQHARRSTASFTITLHCTNHHQLHKQQDTPTITVVVGRRQNVNLYRAIFSPVSSIPSCVSGARPPRNRLFATQAGGI